MEDLQIMYQEKLNVGINVKLTDFQDSLGKAVAAILWYRTPVVLSVTSEQS